MTIIKTKRLSDGTFVEVLPDGSTQPSVGKTDWARLNAMTEEEIMTAALSDPDAQPLTEEQLSRMKRTPRTKIIRRVLHLSQEEFALRYHIPIGTLRDWELGRCEPDPIAKAYLHVIAYNPDGVVAALNSPVPPMKPDRP
jgi:putative transcriptional regulator